MQTYSSRRRITTQALQQTFGKTRVRCCCQCVKYMTQLAFIRMNTSVLSFPRHIHDNTLARVQNSFIKTAHLGSKTVMMSGLTSVSCSNPPPLERKSFRLTYTRPKPDNGNPLIRRMKSLKPPSLCTLHLFHIVSRAKSPNSTPATRFNLDSIPCAAERNGRRPACLGFLFNYHRELWEGNNSLISQNFCGDKRDYYYFHHNNIMTTK